MAALWLVGRKAEPPISAMASRSADVPGFLGLVAETGGKRLSKLLRVSAIAVGIWA